jgi:hypothetical protein
MSRSSTVKHDTSAVISVVEVFLYLQLLDFMTTVIGLRIGVQEFSPFIRLLMRWDPIIGVSISKLIAGLLGGICLWQRKIRVIKWINYGFAALVAWNLFIILKFLNL